MKNSTEKSYKQENNESLNELTSSFSSSLEESNIVAAGNANLLITNQQMSAIPLNSEIIIENNIKEEEFKPHDFSKNFNESKLTSIMVKREIAC